MNKPFSLFTEHRIVLIGNPNSGKSSLFNALTGAHQRVGNWSGVTVSAETGVFEQDQMRISVVDLPGTYSISGLSGDASVDERLPYEFLSTQPYDCIINVVDATHLERHLYLTLQLLELGRPVIVALTMGDALLKKGQRVHCERLSHRLGCPVVSVVPTQKSGREAFKRFLMESMHTLESGGGMALTAMIYQMPCIDAAIQQLAECVAQEQREGHLSRFLAPRAIAWHCLESDWQAIPDLSDQLKRALQKAAAQIEQETGYEADIAIAKWRYDRIERYRQEFYQSSACRKSVSMEGQEPWIDRWVLNRYLGVPIFLMVMYTLFFVAIQVGGIFESGVDVLSHGVFIEALSYYLHQWHWPAWLISILAQGLGEGISTVLTFTPVIGILFLCLTILEDSGYMARAAFVVDRLMQGLGLPGKSFVPMIIGFGCNVPAIMAARTLERERDRILTIMMTPFMSCSARLAIYMLFVSAFFPKQGYNIVFILYLVGIFMAMLTGWLLKKTILSGEVSPLVMEFPPYRRPSWRTVGIHAWVKTRRFIVNAGKLIIPVCLLIGALNSIQFKDNSVLAWLGKASTPLFHPMGIQSDNWPATVGLMTGIMAKEVVVGTLNTLYAQASEATVRSFSWVSLGQASVRALWAGVPEVSMGAQATNEMILRFQGQAGAFAYLLFVLLYFPCVSATSAIAKEVNGRWSMVSILWTTGLAYAVAVMFYQASQLPLGGWPPVAWILGMMTFLVLGFYGLCFLARDHSRTSSTVGRAIPTPIILG